MKKLTTSLFMLLAFAMNTLAASITASDYDFGSVSIKGKTDVMDVADVVVSWKGLSNIAIYAEIAEDSPSDVFFIASDNDYFYINSYANPVPTSCTFSIGYLATAAGTYTGKIHFYSYDPQGNDVEKTITVSLKVTNSVEVPQTTPFARINTTSEFKEGDVVVFVSESSAAVGAPLNGTNLPAITEGFKIDVEKGTAEVPATAQTFSMSKYNGNWQFTNTNTGNRLLLDISGSGAFCYGNPDKEHLAGWGISISKGIAIVSRPDEEQSFQVQYNAERFKPYKTTQIYSEISLYKKTGEAHDIKSTVSLDGAIDMGETEVGEKKSLEVGYTAENLTDDIIWAVTGADAKLFDVTSTGDRESGKLTITYNGTGEKAGKVSASLAYLTQDIALDVMEGEFPISLNLVTNTIKLTNIKFDNSTYDVNLGETINLMSHLTLTPANAADKSLTWESSDKAYATVDANGVVTPLISGKVTITATSVRVPEVNATCEVNIKVPAATSVSVEPGEVEMHIGDKQTLTISVLPAGAKQEVTYTSDNTAVATVSTKGVVTAKAIGTAVITIATKENGNIKTTCNVKVVPQTVESISFNPAQVTVTKGFKLQLEPIITPAAAAADNKVTYLSDNEKVATVDANGIVTGVEVGQTDITATCAGKQAKVTVSVEEADMFTKVTDAASLKSKDTIIIALKTAEYQVVAGPLIDKQLSAITENVTITDNSATAEGALQLVLESANGGFRLVPVGKTKGLAENGNTFAEQTTKNNYIWTFEADENGVYIRNAGNTNAYVKYNPNNSYIRPYKLNSDGPVMMYTYVRAHKDAQPAKVTGVTLSKTSIELAIGATEKLIATVAPANAADKSVVWSSSDESVATVAEGTVTAISEGTATITVKTNDGGFTAQCEVTVKAPIKVTGVSLSRKELSLMEGESSKLIATVAPDNAADKSVVWSSSDESVATVTEGTVTAISEGTATITVKTNDGGFTAQCDVTVKAGTPVVGNKGEKGNPYTTAEVKELGASSTKVWVIGYIWGQPSSASSLKTSPADDTNMAIGDSPDSDGTSFIPVELPKGNIRSELGLASNPEHIGRRVKVYGTIEKYFGVVGVKKVTDYEWADGDAPVEPAPAPVFSIEEGEVTRGTELIISAERPDDRLFVRIDGEEGEWEEYEGHCHYIIDRDLTIEAYVERDGFLPSETVSKTYTVKLEDAVESVDANRQAARKVLRDGHLLIIMPDGTTYTATGAKQ